MSSSRKVPEDPVSFIRACLSAGRVLWTYHVNMRMRERSVSRHQILRAVSTFEVIEEYPEDKYFPSYLVFCRIEEQVFHVLFATDLEDGNVRVVTVYRPKEEDWDPDLRRRKQP